MKKFFFFLFLISCMPGFSQKKNGKTASFDLLFDTLLINASKNGFKEVTITIIPYEYKNEWTEVYDEQKTGEFGRVTSTWTFLNDSIVQQEIEDRYYCGLIKGNTIYEYNRRKKKIIPNPFQTERDSSGYTIIESDYHHTKDPYYTFSRNIEDSVGHTLIRFYYVGGKLCNYDRYTYYGDTAYRMKTYTKKEDSLCYANYDVEGQILSGWIHSDTMNTPEYYLLNDDSLPLIQDLYVCKKLSRDHRTEIDSINTTSYFIYYKQKPIIKKNILKYSYVYDLDGKLVGGEELSYENGSELYWKNEMTVTYKK
jgi:hypothetical protein